MNRCSGLVKEIKIFLYRLSFYNIMILGICNEWMRRKRKKYSDISYNVLDFNALIIISSKYMASIEIGRGWPYFFVRHTFNAEKSSWYECFMLLLLWIHINIFLYFQSSANIDILIIVLVLCFLPIFKTNDWFPISVVQAYSFDFYI